MTSNPVRYTWENEVFFFFETYKFKWMYIIIVTYICICICIYICDMILDLRTGLLEKASRAYLHMCIFELALLMCPVDVTWRSKNAWYDSFWRSGIQTSLLTFRRPWCSAFSILCILPRNRHIGPTATRIFQFIQEEAFWQILEHVDGWNVCFIRPYHIDMHYFLSSSTG